MVEKQALFMRTISEFVPIAYNMGFLLTAAEFWRPEIVAQMYEKLKKGISNSLHLIRLAADLNAYIKINGEWIWLDGHEDWHIPHLEKLGNLWKSLDENCAWGGDFSGENGVKKDFNHYSFQHNGVK